MTFKSVFPPVCVKGPVSRKWYVIADGVWHQVGRNYPWTELEKMWQKIELPNKELPKKKTNKKTWMVVGSKGNTYTVTSDQGVWTCSCPAHGFGRGKDCKHITNLKLK